MSGMGLTNSVKLKEVQLVAHRVFMHSLNSLKMYNVTVKARTIYMMTYYFADKKLVDSLFGAMLAFMYCSFLSVFIAL